MTDIVIKEVEHGFAGDVDAISSKIINFNKTDYDNPTLFTGEQAGLFNTLSRPHTEIERLFKKLKAQDWDEKEFPADSCKAEFAENPRSLTNPMIRTLAWQWETDTIAARVMGLFAALAATYDPLVEIYTRIADNENLHARTYSEIVRLSFEDPQAVLQDILEIRESKQRLATVGKVFTETLEILIEVRQGRAVRDKVYYKAIYKFLATMYVMERLQFTGSFAVTFTYGENSMFMPIAAAVKKICQDELEIHAVLGKYLVKACLNEPEMLEAKLLCQDEVKQIVDEVVDNELYWIDYFLEGMDDLFGNTREDYRGCILFNAAVVYADLEVQTDREFPKENPLTFMTKWLVQDNFQAAPQEEKNGNYVFGYLIRDDKQYFSDIEI